MEIKYLGHSSFFIKAKETKIVTDPYDPKMVGFKFPRVEADIITVSHTHKDHSAVTEVGGTPTIFTWPGQFEKMGVRIWGYRTFHDKEEGATRGENIMYKFESEGVSLLHCGDLGVIPPDAFLDEVGEVDILLVPVGNKYTIDAAEAVELIKKVEPSIVVPMHYGVQGLAIEGLAPIEDFIKKMGIENPVPLDKLIVKKEGLGEDTKVVVLKP